MRRIVTWLWLATTAAPATELYSTGFENFTPGPDRIAGALAFGTSPAIPPTDGWTGSHAGQDRSGIQAESAHQLPGMGNVAYLGGNTDPIPSDGALMFVRKVFNYQPVAEGSDHEVVTLRVLTGIADSSGGSTRDDFEFFIYNNNSLGGGTAGAFPLAGIQFDNSQINPSTLKPWQAIYRYGFNSTSGGMSYFPTGVNFVYDTVEALEMRINFRTNLWSASLAGIPLFSDIPFYNGPRVRNLGSLLVQCRVSSTLAPGSNYLIFDDLSVEAGPPLEGGPPDLSYSPGSGTVLRWFQEAGYAYEVRVADGLDGWQPAPGGSATTPAALTGYTGHFTDAGALGLPRRFYQIFPIPP